VAHLVRPVITSYELNGKRVPKGTPKAKKVRQKAGRSPKVNGAVVANL
jgi:hypothetical protein